MINTTKVEWGNETNNFEIYTGSVGDIPEFEYFTIPGDFNGDGLTDIFDIAKDPRLVPGHGGLVFDCNLYYSQYKADGEIEFELKYSDFFSASYENTTFEIGDFNGDGKVELLMSYNYNNQHHFKIIDPNQPHFMSNSRPGPIFELTSYSNYKVGDFNGDGITDLLTYFNQVQPINKISLNLFKGTPSGYLEAPVTQQFM